MTDDREAALARIRGDEEGDGPWVLFMWRNKLVMRRPWCDCPKKVVDRQWPRMVKVSDRKWVRPCCNRPINKEAWKRWQRLDAEAADERQTNGK